MFITRLPTSPTTKSILLLTNFYDSLFVYLVLTRCNNPIIHLINSALFEKSTKTYNIYTHIVNSNGIDKISGT